MRTASLNLLRWLEVLRTALEQRRIIDVPKPLTETAEQQVADVGKVLEKGKRLSERWWICATDADQM